MGRYGVELISTERTHAADGGISRLRWTAESNLTYTFKPASPESVYSFSIVLLEPPAPAALEDEGRGAAGARRLQ